MSAFFKYDGETLLEAPNFVYTPTLTLKIEDKDTYQYPQEDWYWFNSREEAKAFYGIVEEEIPQEENNTEL